MGNFLLIVIDVGSYFLEFIKNTLELFTTQQLEVFDFIFLIMLFFTFASNLNFAIATLNNFKRTLQLVIIHSISRNLVQATVVGTCQKKLVTFLLVLAADYLPLCCDLTILAVTRTVSSKVTG